jgi:hypothetical protein
LELEQFVRRGQAAQKAVNDVIAAVRFEPGDRVRLAIPTAFNSGRSGTVVSRVVSNETLLRVRWDGAKHERSVAEARLKKSYTPSPKGDEHRRKGSNVVG